MNNDRKQNIQQRDSRRQRGRGGNSNSNSNNNKNNSAPPHDNDDDAGRRADSNKKRRLQVQRNAREQNVQDSRGGVGGISRNNFRGVDDDTNVPTPGDVYIDEEGNYENSQQPALFLSQNQEVITVSEIPSVAKTTMTSEENNDAPNLTSTTPFTSSRVTTQSVPSSSSSQLAATGTTHFENQRHQSPQNPDIFSGNSQTTNILPSFLHDSLSELPCSSASSAQQESNHQLFCAEQKDNISTTTITGDKNLEGVKTGTRRENEEWAISQPGQTSAVTKKDLQEQDGIFLPGAIDQHSSARHISASYTNNSQNDVSCSSSQHNARTTTTTDRTASTTTTTSDTLANIQQPQSNIQQPQSLFLLQQQQQQLLRMLGMMISSSETTNASPSSLFVSNSNRDSSGNDVRSHLAGPHHLAHLRTATIERPSSSSAATNLLDLSNPLLLGLLQTIVLPTTANNLNFFSSDVPVNPQTSTATSNSIMLLLDTLLQQATSSWNSTAAAAATTTTNTTTNTNTTNSSTNTEQEVVMSSNFVDTMISSSGNQQGMLVTPNNFTNTPFSSSSDTGRMSSDDALLLQRRFQRSLAMQQLQQDQYELQYRMLLLDRSNIDAASFDGAQHGILGTAAGLRASEMINGGMFISPSSQQSDPMSLLSSGLRSNSSNILGGGGNEGLSSLNSMSPRIGSNTMASAITNISSTAGATIGTSPNNVISSAATSGDDLRNDSLNRIGGLLGALPTTGLVSFAAAYAAAGSTSFGDLPPVPPSQNNALFNSTTNRQIASDGFPVDLPTPLALPEDLVRLSAHQVFLRQQIEAFRATEDDASTHTRGRNKPIQRGQVGIRCRYCAHIPVDKRQKGSTYFPATVLGIYQAAQNMCTTHLQCGLCSEMPESVRQEFSHLLSTKSSSSGAGRPYWESAAESLGLVDTENYGIRFVRDAFPASSGGESPRTRNSFGSNSSQQQKQPREDGG